MNVAGHPRGYPWRRALLLSLLALATLGLVWRAAYLQVVTKEFLQYQGDARHLRVVDIPAHRGVISDRRGEPLAMSTPVQSLWANPQQFNFERGPLTKLARLLKTDPDALQRKLAKRAEREFVYLKRHLTPDVAAQIEALALPGLYLQREYRRYYPAGEVAAHVVGFTDIDDEGQEGVELAFNGWLKGEPGAKRVIKDRLGHAVEDVESIRQAEPGKALRLALDRRLQYLAYRELKAAVLEHGARSGSAVLLDVASGEILAMVNQPSFNPHKRHGLRQGHQRNRAVTDVFEPGSTIKPFTVAAALESGRFKPATPIETQPGYMRVGRHTVRDMHDYGRLDVTGVITKSSNVGSSKIALALDPEQLWQTLDRVGFGVDAGTGFPGEASGWLAHFARWRRIEQATLAFGYGLSATTLQLARAYAVLAAGGILRPVSLTRVDEAPAGQRVMTADTAAQVTRMLETVITKEGTAPRAAVAGYRVAGKTGTVHKATAGGYAEDRYVSVFAGYAPASRPRLALAVMINEPGNGEHYGGKVAAPVFSNVMAGALRLLDVAPDALPEVDVRLAHLRDQPAGIEP